MSDIAGALREPWPNLRLQREGVGVGMWLFLASEVLFFGGLFVTYAIYRSFNAEAFRIAGEHTEIVYGSINTVLLLTSSLTMTIALRAATVEQRVLTLRCLAVTAGLGFAFLVCKGLEYYGDLKEHLVPGPHFPLVAASDANILGSLLGDDRHSRHPSVSWHHSGTGRLHLVQAARNPGAGLNNGRDSDLLALRRFGLGRALSADLSRGPPMNDGNSSRRLWIGPLEAWGVLVILFAATLGSAYLPLGTANVAINLAIAAAMVAVLATFLMDLRNSTALIRIIAAAGGLWIIIMFSLIFVDYLSRSY